MQVIDANPYIDLTANELSQRLRIKLREGRALLRALQRLGHARILGHTTPRGPGRLQVIWRVSLQATINLEER